MSGGKATGTPGKPAVDDRAIGQLVLRLANELLRRGWKLAAAESCTGGWVAKCCTDMAGSSAWFDRGFVTYSNAAKQEMLKVSAETLARDGAVSECVALEMARGACEAAGTEAALAVTGIAGPDGGTAEKPVGMVWFAWSLGEGESATVLRQFHGDREAVRRQSVEQALKGLLQLLEQS